MRPAPGFGPVDDPQGRRLAALVRVSAQILWIANPMGEVTEDSPSWREFTGQTLAEFLGIGWLDAIHPEDRTRTLIAWRSARESRTRYEVTYRLRFRGEAWRWARARGTPVLGVNDEVECWVGVINDITFQRNAEAALAESELHFKSIAETVPDFIWLADAEGRIEYWNPAWYSFTGMLPSASMGHGASAVVREDVRAGVAEAWHRAVAAEVAFEAEAPVRDAAGDYHWFIARARPIRDESGRVVRWCGVMANIDDQKRITEELRRERGLREQFVSGLVHDLRNVCGAGKSAHAFLVSHEDEDSERRQYEELVTRAFERVERMIGDLLDANRVDAGRPFPLKSRSNFDLSECVSEVIAAMKEPREGKFRIAITPGLRVHWSREDFVRALENLVCNAQKYGHADTQITIGAKADGDDVTWFVHNFGPEIPASAQSSLFDFLKRVDDERSRARAGWGIGLTLVKGIVEAHGGRIGVESNQKFGTTFSVTMPRG